ncbi:MAG TPA: hypothetical protein VNZ68_01215 [Rhodocyclaceae bacterium]|nr:hypothetical protein [Rhodocyclaceae bacterium]
MASITHRGPYQWQAIVRGRGFPSQTKTFETEQAARAWAAEKEAERTLRLTVDNSEFSRVTLGQLPELADAG